MNSGGVFYLDRCKLDTSAFYHLPTDSKRSSALASR